MPFIAPFIPMIAGVAGGLLVGRKPKRDSTENDILGRQLGLSDFALDALKSSKDYWGGILKGGPDAALALSPEIRSTARGYDNQRTSIGMFGPLGGGRASLMTRLPMERMAAISDIYSRARPAAAQGMAGIGNAASGMMSGLGGMMANEMERGKIGANRGAALGSGLFNIASSVPWDRIFNRGGGGGGGGSSATLPFPYVN